MRMNSRANVDMRRGWICMPCPGNHSTDTAVRYPTTMRTAPPVVQLVMSSAATDALGHSTLSAWA